MRGFDLPVALLVSLHLAPIAAPVVLNAQASTIVVVRHAEKQDTTKDSGLSEAGLVRAEALRTTLTEFQLQGVFVSEYQRTLQTAAPTAEAFHLVPTAIPIQGDKLAQAAATAEGIRHMPSGSAALVVGHSNTVGLLIAALGGPAVPELCDNEYATLFVLELPDSLPPRLLRASFGTPDPADTVACHADTPANADANRMN